jgi:hypothetical protein
VLIVVPTLPDVKKQYLIKGDMCKSSRKMVNNEADCWVTNLLQS